jgi:beta-lactamase class A
MYPNKQLGWAVPNGRHAHPATIHQTSFLRTPAYKHLAIALVLFVGIFVTGTSKIINSMASNQVVYQPAISTSGNSSPTPQPTTNSAVAPDPKPEQQPVVAPPVVDHSAQVQAVLDSWKASHASQQWGIVVQGLGVDTTSASINQNASFGMASIYKLFMMYPLFKNYSLESLAAANITVSGRGAISLKSCVELMIKNSDNPCGEAVGYRLGWSKATTLLKQLGLKNTNLNTQALSTTAADATLFLQKFNDGQLMGPAEQEYITTLMQQQRFRSGIPAGCAGCIVADKTGDLGFVRHDIGIVDSSGKKYVLAIMTNGVSYALIAQLTSQVQTAMAN